MKFATALGLSLAIVLVFCFGQGLAIECFHCHSYMNETCDDPFEQSSNDTSASTFLIDCDTLQNGRNYTFCRKTIQTAALYPRETVRVIRSCGFIEDPKFESDYPSQLRCYRRTGTYAVEYLYCGCSTDGCNSGNLVFASASATIFAVLFSWIGKMYH